MKTQGSGSRAEGIIIVHGLFCYTIITHMNITITIKFQCIMQP